jgi:hypothetical protein
MLLIYRQATGEVIDNSGTNSMYPEGVPDDMAWGGRDRSGLALLRLHDGRDAALVKSALTHKTTVKNGQVVIGDPLPAPVVATPVDDIVTREEFNQLMTMFLEG